MNRAILFVGIFFLGFGLLLHVAGLATPEMFETQVFMQVPELGPRSDGLYIKVNVGLFKACANDECKSFSAKQTSSARRAAQALAVLGFLFGALALLLAVINFGLAFFSKMKKALGTLTAVACFVSLMGIVFGLLVFRFDLEGNTANAKVAYSFILCCVGAILVTLGGLFSLLGTRVN